MDNNIKLPGRVLKSFAGVYLCRCTNCNEVFVDTNPQSGARRYEDTGEFRELTLMEDADGDFMRACPNCETDEYLIDL